MKCGVQTRVVRGGRCDHVPICVMGATSALGLRIIEHLLAHTQYSVRAVVRDLNKVPPLWSFDHRVDCVAWSVGRLLPERVFDSARGIIWLVHAKGNRSGNEIALNSNALKSACRLRARSGVQ